MTRLERGIKSMVAPRAPNVNNATTVQSLLDSGVQFGDFSGMGDTAAMKLSAVNRCIEILAGSMSKLPVYFFDTHTRERVRHPLHNLLSVRPNEAMTPSVRKAMLESNRLCGGNGYEWIIRDRRSMLPVELIPLPFELVNSKIDDKGHVWYYVTHPYSGETMRLHSTDVCHYKGYSRDGRTGVSVLSRAAEVLSSGRAAQQYEAAYYKNGGRPSGVLTLDSDLSGVLKIKQADGSEVEVSKKDILRREWEKCYTGPSNSHRTAILDLGTKYEAISLSNKDAQFVESKEVSVKDIARFFGVPLYKLQEGKQSYSSNEQNAIEYVVGTLHPIVTQYEEEQTWKLLMDSDTAAGLEVRINMMAELKGDAASRSSWYKNMRECSAYSPNDIRALEDMPDTPGGDDLYASLNYVPLSDWKGLSRARNKGGTNASNT